MGKRNRETWISIAKENESKHKKTLSVCETQRQALIHLRQANEILQVEKAWLVKWVRVLALSTVALPVIVILIHFVECGA